MSINGQEFWNVFALLDKSLVLLGMTSFVAEKVTSCESMDGHHA
jgi:hypothetical protein